MNDPTKNLQGALEQQLAGFVTDPSSPVPRTVQLAIALARHLQHRANELQTPSERRQQAELDRMMHHPQDKVTLTELTDQAFRSHSPVRAVDQLVHILDVQGIPRFFTPMDRALLRGFQSFGAFLPGVAVPLVKEKMQQETANVILPAEAELLGEHLQNRRAEGVRMNVNLLGEALLGEDDAQNRLRGYLQALQLPEIEVISVKISTIYSQISPLAREHTLAVLADRLELLYRASAKATFRRADGTEVPKFVYLDMEEYRDMLLTSEVFMRTLERPGLESASAGLVLQAYVPDSFRTQRQITEWAQQRVAQGGAPVTLRIVKGANMEMERFEAGLFGWPQAPYQEKLDTDANYRRMVQYGMRPEHISAVRLGIASHNLFEVAYALVLAVECQVLPHIQFEMLEGMANHQRRALFELVNNLLLYAPACKQEDFIHAIGYLVRRLDENTGPDNFLRHAFRLAVDSPDWKRLEQQFVDAFARIDQLSDAPRRTQDRRQPPSDPPAGGPDRFLNEPDTDWSLPQNQDWAQEILAARKPRYGDAAPDVPLVVGGESRFEGRPLRECLDPSRPGKVVGRYAQGQAEDVESALTTANQPASAWRQASPQERRQRLQNVAAELRRQRGELLALAVADGGKTLAEADPEVSEAIDFVEFYSRSALDWYTLPGLQAQPRGIVVVVSPWNFPIAIPCGGIAAALAAGNHVILKPASDTVLIAARLCQCFWDAGIPQDVLQFLPCSGGQEGQQLVADERVDTVILTGGTATALAMLRHRPPMRLLAETGGKNATIVTAMADRDQAIKHVLHSAFGHAGQKCSATSLLILEAEVYDDPKFKQALCDAVSSLPVGSAWDVKHKMGPMIRPPSGELETALKELEPGESWAVMPRKHAKNPHIYSPAVKWGVQPGSFTHKTEFFGPVLGVMRAANLGEAIELANATGYGLTSGLESLDDREQTEWMQMLRAGNLYINRGTTGAIVLRQPFGGMGKSAFGPGIKAGGPNYVAPLMRFQPAEECHDPGDPPANRHLRLLAEQLSSCPAITDDDRRRLRAAMSSFAYYQGGEFSQEHDAFRLIGQDNLRRYLVVREVRIRVHPDDDGFSILARVAAGSTAGCRLTISWDPQIDAASTARQVVDWLDTATDPWAAAIEFVEESDSALAQVVRERGTQRIRVAGPQRVSDEVRLAAAETNTYIADAEVLGQGRVELLWYVEEQSISRNYHRYGNLGRRSDEDRAPVL